MDYLDVPRSPRTPSTSTLAPGDTSQHSKSNGDTTLKIVLTGSSIVLAVFLVSLGLLFQVFLLHVYHITGGSVYTTAPLGRTLTIAHTSSVVLSVSAPLAIGLGAYWLAGNWLVSSSDEGRDRPTPYQLGVLMETLHGANLPALWTGATYVLGRGSVPGGRTLGRPPMLRHAVLMLLAFLTLAYGSSVVELWLGASSEAVVYAVTTQLGHTGEPLSALSRQVNQTLCDEWKDSITNQPYQCGLVRGSGGNSMALSAQIRTMNGLSGSNDIAFTDDSTAIMVPPAANLSHSLQYTATTYGVKSSCTSMTAECIDPTNLGPNAGLLINCPTSVNYNTSSQGCSSFQGLGVGTSTGGPIDSNGQVFPCTQNANSTDFRFGMTVISSAYSLDGTTDHFVDDTGFFIHGNQGAYNVLVCDVNSLNVTYRYFNGSYTMLASTASDVAQGQRVSDGSQAAVSYAPMAINGAGLLSGSYNGSFANQLSLVALSMTSYVMEPADALDIQSIEATIGSRLPLAPLSLLILISTVYCLLVIAVTLKAMFEIRKYPHAAFAQNRLVDPATAISTAYGPEEFKLKLTASTLELFGHETDGDRLTLDLGRQGAELPVIRRSARRQRASWVSFGTRSEESLLK
ncbi:hypothetical protein C8F04DRAFT_1131042 [Mycena alexandri]|uniref:Uncharacterized protein n=1 Tax=Mycena alexandri TaxID=1745969 RepID=A0AAD6SBU2_9AGAR|nr:hypothetical protein C8F04DRAFT_1131042 [Mycena alexandri]